MLESTIKQLENNVRFLALSGASFYYFNKDNKEVLDFLSTEYMKVPTNIVIGIFGDITFEAIKFKMNPLDTLVLYTDGVTEANNMNNELYGEDRKAGELGLLMVKNMMDNVEYEYFNKQNILKLTCSKI